MTTTASRHTESIFRALFFIFLVISWLTVNVPLFCRPLIWRFHRYVLPCSPDMRVWKPYGLRYVWVLNRWPLVNDLPNAWFEMNATQMPSWLNVLLIASETLAVYSQETKQLKMFCFLVKVYAATIGLTLQATGSSSHSSSYVLFRKLDSTSSHLLL